MRQRQQVYTIVVKQLCLIEAGHIQIVCGKFQDDIPLSKTYTITLAKNTMGEKNLYVEFTGSLDKFRPDCMNEI